MRSGKPEKQTAQLSTPLSRKHYKTSYRYFLCNHNFLGSLVHNLLAPSPCITRISLMQDLFYIRNPCKQNIQNIRESPTYAVFTIADPTTAIFGLCMPKWGIFGLVVQSHYREFCVTWFFSSPKIRVRWGPFCTADCLTFFLKQML